MAVYIYTDGACEPNPGRGGWGVVIVYPNKKSIDLYGGESHTTSNRMELLAVIKGFEYFKQPTEIIVLSDSKYVVNGINDWIYKWKKKGKIMKNMDLWNRIWKWIYFHKVKAVWVKGHEGNFYNERADSLSTMNIPESKYSKYVSKEKVDEYIDKQLLKSFRY